MAVDLETKLAAVESYFGESTWWDRISVQGLTPSQIEGLYNQLPASSFAVDVTPSGLVLGRQYQNPFELPVIPGSDWDSNIPGGSYEGGNTFTGNIPGSIVVDPTTGLPVRMQGGATTSSGTQLPTIVDRISLAVAGVNIGAKLGLKIDELLYQLNPSWWDENLPGINPQTWDSLVGVSPVGDFFLRTLFGIDGSSMTGYINADVLAYYYQMLRDVGVFSEGGGTATLDDTSKLPSQFRDIHTIDWGPGSITATRVNPAAVATINIPGTFSVAFDRGNDYEVKFFSDAVVTGTFTMLYTETGQSVTYSASTRYVADSYISNKRIYVTNYVFNKTYYIDISLPTVLSNTLNDDRSIGTYLLDGDIIQQGGVDGIGPMSEATQYPSTDITGTTPQEVRQQLQQQYPELFYDPITETTMQEDGTVTTTTYIPIPWVTEGLRPQTPITLDERTQGDIDIDPETGDEVLPTTPPGTPTDTPPTGEGDTPIVVTPTGSASSLWAVYNPSQSQLNAFGSWLWSSDFVDQIKKLFADPMQAIIGIHKVFASPPTGGSQTIKCGYLDSGVSAPVVTNQYTTINCGSAKLREYFGNVFDYEPYTRVSLFLPFIGVVPLNVSEVMRSTVSVTYRVDVITGACLAEVSVSRDGAGGVLYTYGGSAIVTYPISSGSYVGAVQSALSTAIGIGLVASGGGSIGAVAGLALNGISRAKTQVQHSGQFTGSSGAMGGKKPYLIVTRPQTHTPTQINEYKGLPSTSIYKLSKYTGYVKVNEVHITSTKAYDNEIQEIESLLKSGVIF